MIRVGICTFPLTSGHKSRGIGFYTKNLLKELQKRSSIQVIEFNDINKLENVDLVHYFYFDLFIKSLPLRKKFPTVVTIHDVTPLVFPKHYPPGIRGKIKYFLQRLSLLNVQAIITDSKYSKEDIIKYLKINPHKIYPIHLASDKYFRPLKQQSVSSKIVSEYNLPNKFVVYLGSINWNKNLNGLTQASLETGVDVVLIGQDFEDKNGLEHIERKSYRQFLKKFSTDPRVHILGFVPDNDLVIIFNLAQMLLYPSFYEGFGLPILQAQACGLPVITSNVSSMPEIAGDGALFVDPYNVGEIKQEIQRIINDDKLKKHLIKKGFKNLKRFSWEKVADETIAVYQTVLNK